MQENIYKTKIKDLSVITDKILSNYKTIKNLIDDNKSLKAIDIVDETKHIKRMYNLNYKILKELYEDKKNKKNVSKIEYDSNKLLEVEDSLKKKFNKINENTREHLSELDLFLINNLPFDWDWNQDLIILLGPVSLDLVKKLRKKKQKRIWLINKDQKDFKEGEFILTSDIEKIQLSNYYQSPPIKIILWNFQNDMLYEKKIKNKIKFLQASFKSNKTNINNFLEYWLINGFHNLTKLTKSPNISTIYNKIENNKCIFVGTGPSLDKNKSILRKNRDKIFICACLHSLKALEKANIVPDIVIHADPIEVEWIRDIIKDYDFSKIELLLLSATVNKSLFSLKAKNIIWFNSNNYYDKWFCNLYGNIEVLNYPIGISIIALQILLKIGFNEIIFIGTDLAYKENNFYADAAKSIDDANRNTQGFKKKQVPKIIKIKGFYNKIIKTSSFYLRQLRCLEATVKILSKNYNKIKLYNCTEGGAYIEGFQHTTLKNYLEVTKKEKKIKPFKNILNEANQNNKLVENIIKTKISIYKENFKKDLENLQEKLILINSYKNNFSNIEYEILQNTNIVISNICDKYELLNLIFQNEYNNLDFGYEYFIDELKQNKIVSFYNTFLKKIDYLKKEIS